MRALAHISIIESSIGMASGQRVNRLTIVKSRSCFPKSGGPHDINVDAAKVLVMRVPLDKSGVYMKLNLFRNGRHGIVNTSGELYA